MDDTLKKILIAPRGIDYRTAAISVPASLSSLEEKLQTYAREIYFRECWEEMLSYRAEAEVLRSILRTTLILVKPDGVAARVIYPTLKALEEHGFEALAGAAVRLDRLSMRELWRYELNLATMQRMSAIDALLTTGPSLLLLLSDQTYSGEKSAAERLRIWKGPSQGARPPDRLRSLICSLPGLLNYIHAPDEPADVIRELGVLLSRPDRGRFIKALFERPDIVSINRAAAECEGAIRARDLRLEPVIERLSLLLESLPCKKRATTRARVALRNARAMSKCDWELVFNVIDRFHGTYDPWDRAVMAAWCSELHVPGISPIFNLK